MFPIEKVRELKKRKAHIYIYGAGIYGRAIFKILKNNNIAVSGFVVSKKTTEFSSELPIYEARNILGPDAGIIMGVKNTDSIKSVKELLESLQFNMNDVVSEYDFFMTKNMEKNEQELLRPYVEITTKIGCSINCRYCPQSLLLDAYFKGDRKRVQMMSLEVFSRCLERLPTNCVVKFCGFVEPLLNPDCIEMIELACRSGRSVDLYTTLVGATDVVVDQICAIPFRRVGLHVADRYGYANIPVSEQYYNNIDKLVNCRKQDGTPLIDICNSQAEPDPKIIEICSGKYDILTVLHNRAGNLADSELLTKEYPTETILCTTTSELQGSVLLPDGTLVLCCMDFGMKHVLGNLLEKSYDEIISGSEMSKVKQGMEIGGSDILCRKCPHAHPVAKNRPISREVTARE